MEIGLFIALIVALYIAYAFYKARRFKKRCLEIFETVFSKEAVIPEYRLGSSYGFPSFTLIFPKKSDLARAEVSGITEIFKRELKNICANDVSPEYPFDIERAVYFYSKEK
jgi:hypothetical protein